jgi:anti-sigma regulatory factor (Ser/Thr protein kinase)
MTSTTDDNAMLQTAFRHEAFFYAGEQQFLDGTVGFVHDGVRVGEPVLVAVAPAKTELLRSALGADASAVTFVEMAGLGRNPACIIPAWRDFADSHLAAGRRVRGIGEPIWPGRSDDELVECHLHESLLNLAFDGGEPWWLLCPYDVAGLRPDVVASALCTHPFVSESGSRSASAHYTDAPQSVAAMLDVPLAPVPADAMVTTFSRFHLGGVRSIVERVGAEVGLSPERRTEAVLAVHEAATNSLRHGGGGGTLLCWREGDAAVFEVRDRGHLTEALAGRRRPGAEQDGGRGLWLMNQLCDLVQLRSSPSGTMVRMFVRRD